MPFSAFLLEPSADAASKLKLSFVVMDSPKTQLNTPIFMSLVILICWTIWTTRNDLIFQEIQPSIVECRAYFRKELVLLMHRVRDKHKLVLEEWISSFG
jgi:hypothetical protein